jgi:hypothetical protein
VVNELNSTGASQRNFVYAGGKVLAESGLIVHDEVSGTSVRKTSAQSGYTIIFDELDPLGADAYTEDPYVEDPQFGGRGEGGPVYPGYGNISDPSRGCTSDGIYGVCEPDLSFWGSSIANLPGFGTNWGSYSQLAEWEYKQRLAYTLARLNGIQRRREGSPRGSDAPPQKTSIDPEIIKKAISDCISAMYPHYALVDFIATRKPVEAKGDKDDRFIGLTTIKDVNTGSTGTIVNDPTPAKSILREIQTHGRGLTRSDNPWWGYVAPDVDQLNAPDTSQVVYPELYGALPFFKTQIHELGGALGLITKMYYPSDYRLFNNRLAPNHQDNGPAFEDCVGRRVYQSLGLTPASLPNRTQ